MRLPGWVNWQFAVLSALWLGWGAAYALGCRPQWRRFQRARESVAPLIRQMESYSALVGQVPNVAQRIAELEERRRKLATQRLGSETIARAIQQLARLAQESKVTIESIAPAEGASQVELSPLPAGVDRRALVVRLRCGYEPLGNFLDGLRGLPVPLAVAGMSIQGGPTGAAETDLGAELWVTTYGLT